MKLNWSNVVALGLCLAAGVGGCLGALALGNDAVAAGILSAVSGLVAGLLAPQIPLRASDEG
jgi:hypothetical protein